MLLQNNIDTTEWTKEHETAFRSMLRRNYSFNSIAKTRRFRAMEKSISGKNKETLSDWKFDKHSPYVNDLDYNDQEYLVNDDTVKKAHISNIRTISEKLEEEKPEEKKLRELQAKTGEGSKNVHKLERISEHMDKYRKFQDAMKGFEAIYKWEHSLELFNKAQEVLSEYLLNKMKVDMRKLNRARYSYLSGKIAFQRAKIELTNKLMERAEERRVELRTR